MLMVIKVLLHYTITMVKLPLVRAFLPTVLLHLTDGEKECTAHYFTPPYRWGERVYLPLFYPTVQWGDRVYSPHTTTSHPHTQPHTHTHSQYIHVCLLDGFSTHMRTLLLLFLLLLLLLLFELREYAGVDPAGVDHVLDHYLTEVKTALSKPQLQQLKVTHLGVKGQSLISGHYSLYTLTVRV